MLRPCLLGLNVLVVLSATIGRSVISQSRLPRLFGSTVRMSSTYEKPIIVGLTGSIGMGKSTITGQLRRLGVPVFDADEAVHELYSRGGEAVDPLSRLFPGVVENGAVCRKKLMEEIVRAPGSLGDVERIVHPLVVARRELFRNTATDRGDLMIVYDIPLLFENRKQYVVDYVVVVTCDAETQRTRVLSRTGMTEDKFQAILRKQVPDEDKRRQADFVIDTGFETYSEGRSQLATTLQAILAKEEARWQAWRLRKAEEARLQQAAVLSSPSPSSPSEADAQELRKHFDAVVFDLDDTLTPTRPPVLAGIEAVKRYTERNMPQTYPVMLERMFQPLDSVKHKYPMISHDITEMRRRALHDIARDFGEEDHVRHCIEELVHVRSQVAPFMYPDVLPFLETLRSADIKLGVLTNGNGDINRCEELQRFNFHSFTAGDVGAGKPSPVGFLAFSQLWNIPPQRILFVGDDYAHDIEAAKAVGMRTLFVRRNATQAPAPLSAEELKTRFPAADVIVKAFDVHSICDALSEIPIAY